MPRDLPLIWTEGNQVPDGASVHRQTGASADLTSAQHRPVVTGPDSDAQIEQVPVHRDQPESQLGGRLVVDPDGIADRGVARQDRENAADGSDGRNPSREVTQRTGEEPPALAHAAMIACGSTARAPP